MGIITVMNLLLLKCHIAITLIAITLGVFDCEEAVHIFYQISDVQSLVFLPPAMVSHTQKKTVGGTKAKSKKLCTRVPPTIYEVEQPNTYNTKLCR